MSEKHHLTLISPEVRAKAHKWVDGVPDGSRLTFEPPKRSIDQNDKLWAMLADIVRHRPKHNGFDMDAETYKCLFMHSLWNEIKFIPSLDGSSMVPIGQSSSKLGKERFSELIELIHAWCAQNGIDLSQ